MVPWLPGPLDRAFVRAWKAGLEALAEALFPEGDPAVPGFETTELVPRMEAYVDSLPPSQRPLVALLFVAVDRLAPLLAPLGPRLGRRPPARRLAVVEGWRGSRIWPLRVLGNAVKASLSMIYFSHPAVFEATGEPAGGAVLVSS
ncbi:MAG: hypothetical protein H6732_02590 [Alphaproteobacteria bacterium]|nr:hypothetical protein [Alphaproteobacteria bacterium]